MAKSTSLAELPSRAPNAQTRSRKRASETLVRRLGEAGKELSTLPMKPLLIGAGIGAALLGAALSLNSKRQSGASLLTGLNPTLTKTALVAIARVVSGQTVRSVTTSALLDVAETLKG